jgi:hypothetical protein
MAGLYCYNAQGFHDEQEKELYKVQLMALTISFVAGCQVKGAKIELEEFSAEAEMEEPNNTTI